MKKKETESVLSPPITEISPTTDIYALRQAAPLVRQTSTVKSPDPVVHSKGVEWGRSESQQEEYYGMLFFYIYKTEQSMCLELTGKTAMFYSIGKQLYLLPVCFPRQQLFVSLDNNCLFP